MSDNYIQNFLNFSLHNFLLPECLRVHINNFIPYTLQFLVVLRDPYEYILFFLFCDKDYNFTFYI